MPSMMAMTQITHDASENVSTPPMMVTASMMKPAVL